MPSSASGPAAFIEALNIDDADCGQRQTPAGGVIRLSLPWPRRVAHLVQRAAGIGGVAIEKDRRRPGLVYREAAVGSCEL